MPHIIMKRSDIPAGTLQVLDLEPNTSQRNLSIDPPGQTKYIDPVVRDQTLAVVNTAGVLTLHREVSGLEAWFITNIDDGGGASLTPAEAIQNATDVLTLLRFGDLTNPAGALTLAAINGALTTGAIVAGQLQGLLDVLAGQTYTVPRGVQVEAAGAFNVQPAIGAAGGPYYGEIRRIYDTGALMLSVVSGELLGFLDSGFVYNGVAGNPNGEAVAVYDDLGAIYVP